MKQTNIYLDYAAATPLDTRVLRAMQPYFSDYFYNSSAIYRESKEIKRAVAEANTKVSRILGAKPTEIINTSGGTEANNLAINGVMQKFPGKKILVSSIEHDSVLEPANQYSSVKIKVKDDGLIDLEDLSKKIDKDTVLVSIMYVNNEIGTLQPLKKIAEIIKNKRKERQIKGNNLPLYFHTDACQAPLYFDLNVGRLGVDMLSLNGGKIYGPKGSGVLYIDRNVEFNPQILGGGQQRGSRSGTENTPSIIGFAEALSQANKNHKENYKKVSQLLQYFKKEIEKLGEKVQINGSLKKRSPANLNVTFFNEDNERLIYELELKGILVGRGSACSAASEEPSHILSAIGLSEKDARATLRFTLGTDTKKSQIDTTIKCLRQLVA